MIYSGFVGEVLGPARRADEFVVVFVPSFHQGAGAAFKEARFASLADSFDEVIADAVFAPAYMHLLVGIEVPIVGVPALAHSIITVVRVIVPDYFYGDDFHAYVWFLFHLYRVDEIVT